MFLLQKKKYKMNNDQLITELIEESYKEGRNETTLETAKITR